MRALNGVLLLDKPPGVTSNGVLQKVRRMYGAKKAGHTGSLDPSATGMLPVCFGEATKLCGYMLDAEKTYTVTALLGITCLLYTSPSPRDKRQSRMPSSA